MTSYRGTPVLGKLRKSLHLCALAYLLNIFQMHWTKRENIPEVCRILL